MLEQVQNVERQAPSHGPRVELEAAPAVTGLGRQQPAVRDGVLEQRLEPFRRQRWGLDVLFPVFYVSLLLPDLRQSARGP
jgi:hypothetical protein